MAITLANTPVRFAMLSSVILGGSAEMSRMISYEHKCIVCVATWILCVCVWENVVWSCGHICSGRSSIYTQMYLTETAII